MQPNEDVIVQQVILLKASPYRLEDSDTHNVIEGVTSYYYPFKGMKLRSSSGRANEEATYGEEPVKVSFAKDFWELIKLKGVPAVYQFEKEMGVDSQTRKEKVKVTNVEFVGYLSPTLSEELPQGQPPKGNK